MDRNAIYRVREYIKHYLTAYNTRGEGIHSPSLFYLVSMIINDQLSYYVWNDIEQRRRAMILWDKTIDVTDYGTGNNRPSQRQICNIAKHSLEKANNAQALFRIINYLSEQYKRPLTIVELGTSLGITTAYLATPNKKNRIFTFEGSSEIANIARLNWNKLNIRNIECIEGNIDNTLFTTYLQQVDFAWLDANHTYEATMRYFTYLLQYVSDKSIIAIDDIHYSPQMKAAWKDICNRNEVTSTMDFYDFGLVFFDKQYIKKHYRLHCV